MRKLFLALEARLFALWVMDRHPLGHPIEWVLYHSYRAVGNAADAMRRHHGPR
jgi:hypothetical protein